MRPGVWLRAARPKFLPQGVLPVVLGTVAAYRAESVFDPGAFGLAFLGAGLVQVGLTVLNDALDYRAGTDRSSTDGKNPYSGGSGVFVDGLLTPEEALRGVAVAYGVAASIGIYLAWLKGVELLVIGLIGVAISVTYSSPPFRLAYRGMGEVAMLVGYGPVITAGSYFVQTSSVTLESLLIGLVPGGLMLCMIVLNEVPDREEDLAAGKMNLVARVGREAGVNIFGALVFALYAGLAAASVTGVFPRSAALAVVAAPLPAGAFFVARRRIGEEGFEDANRMMVGAYSATVLLMCAGYLLG
ncbi:MAG: 1,4-dihydroxy-2-naphthoate octaprenyltransferase [Methanonatronarchaeales archaeon]|nr:1,4-dihydroxy-2-naphthoate octaprenyltransferase [Methanonatronarchaeales archaeon]